MVGLKQGACQFWVAVLDLMISPQLQRLWAVFGNEGGWSDWLNIRNVRHNGASAEVGSPCRTNLVRQDRFVKLIKK